MVLAVLQVPTVPRGGAPEDLLGVALGEAADHRASPALRHHLRELGRSPAPVVLGCEAPLRPVCEALGERVAVALADLDSCAQLQGEEDFGGGESYSYSLAKSLAY